MARYVPLSEVELNNDSSIFSSVAAGFASGVLKTVEGVVSLGAELIDLGADSNTAASVEQFFDDNQMPNLVACLYQKNLTQTHHLQHTSSSNLSPN